jgi:hypothetical protein
MSNSDLKSSASYFYPFILLIGLGLLYFNIYHTIDYKDLVTKYSYTNSDYLKSKHISSIIIYICLCVFLFILYNSSIGKYAMDLYKMMDGFEGEQEVDFPAWLQSKITTAKNMMSSVKHYLDFELKEPQIDAMVNGASLDEKMSKKQIKKRGEIYDTLKDKGMSDEKAGKISTSQAMKAKIKEVVLSKLKQK